MRTSIAEIIVFPFFACINWFTELMEASTVSEIYVGCVVAFLAYKFIFTPVFGVAQSDTAKRTYKAQKARKENKKNP